MEVEPALRVLGVGGKRQDAARGLQVGPRRWHAFRGRRTA